MKVDGLEVEIQSNATKACAELDKMIAKLTEVSSTLTSMPRLNLGGGKSGVSKASNGLKNFTSNAGRATKSTKSLAYAFGKFYANCFMAIRGVKALGKSIKSSMDYIETYNYFNVITDKIGTEFSSAWEENGYSSAEEYAKSFKTRLNDLTGKMTGFDIGDEGGLYMTDSAGLGLDPDKIMTYEASIASITNSLGLCGETSINTSKAMTMLAADMSSLKNVNLDTVMTNLQSGLIGQSRALYKYGIDITNATLQTYAYKYGLKQAVSEMTQADKMQLRLLAILDQSKVAWGDMANTIGGVANQYRILQQQVSNLARIIGNLFLPVIQKVLPYVNGLVIALQRLFTWLGNLLGVKWSGLMDGISSGYTDTGLEELGDSVDDVTDSLDDATGSAKKLKGQLNGFHELNNLSSSSSSGSSGNSSGGGSVDLSGAIDDALAEYEDIWGKAFEGMNDKASKFADDICQYFKNMWNAIEPFRKALKQLWDEGLSKLANFTWTALQDFYENFLVPIGKWAFGEDTGLTRLVNIINDGLMKIQWDDITKNLKEFWIAIEPYAEQFGEGLIDFFEDCTNIAVDVINGIFGNNGAITNITDWLNDNDPEIARDWGYALGQVALALLAFKGLSWIAGIGLNIFTFCKAIADGWVLLKGCTLASWLSGLAKSISNFAFLSGTSTVIMNLANALSFFASINPGMIGEFGLALERFFAGTWMDTNTWTGIPKIIDEFVTGVIDWIGVGIQDVCEAIGQMIVDIFSWSNTLSFFDQAKANFEKGGAYILLGIVDGLAGAVGFLVEPIVNIFTSMYNAFCDAFGIHSPAENMKPIGEYILLGVVEGFTSMFDSFTDAMQTFYDEYVAPWFSIDTWYNLTQGIYDGISLKWEELVSWWNDSINSWWESDVAPWFTVAKWQTTVQGMNDGIKNKWNEHVKLWKTNISTWWTTDVAPWFTLEKWVALGENMKDGIYDGFKGVVNKIYSVINDGVIGGIEGFLNKMVDKINEFIDSINDTLGDFGIVPNLDFNINFGRLTPPAFSTGGFPEDGIFMANHNELIGSFSNGKTAVANNEQIVSGIASGVSSANDKVVNALLTVGNAIVSAVESGSRVEINGTEVFSVVKDEANEYEKQYGEPAFG